MSSLYSFLGVVLLVTAALLAFFSGENFIHSVLLVILAGLLGVGISKAVFPPSRIVDKLIDRKDISDKEKALLVRAYIDARRARLLQFFFNR